MRVVRLDARRAVRILQPACATHVRQNFVGSPARFALGVVSRGAGLVRLESNELSRAGARIDSSRD